MSRASILGTLGLSGFNDPGTVLVSRGSTAQPTFSAAPVLGGVANLNFDRSGPLTRIAANASTGVVTLSAVPSLTDLQAADWTTGNNITNWGTLQSYLSAVAYSNRNISPSAVNFRVFGTTTGYQLSLLVHPNGKLYSFPADIINSPPRTLGFVIDPDNERIITTFFNTGFTVRPLLAPNGKFYMTGLTTRLIVLDPSTNTVNQTINTSPFTFGNTCLARNGKFYGTGAGPSFTGVIIFDPVTETTSSFTGVVDYSSGGFQLAPNGKIYSIPYYTTIFTVIDPDAGTSSTYGFVGGYTLGTFGSVMDFEGSVLSIDGRIFCIPHNTGSAVPASRIGIINPENNTTTTIPGWVSAVGSSVNAQTAFLAPNGKIYTAPNQDSFVVVIDPETNTTTKLIPSIGFPSLQSQGGVIHPNGKAFFVPYYSTAIGVMDMKLNNNWNINVCTNPMFNKQN